MAGCRLVRCVLSGRSRSVARPAGWLGGRRVSAGVAGVEDVLTAGAVLEVGGLEREGGGSTSGGAGAPSGDRISSRGKDTRRRRAAGTRTARYTPAADDHAEPSGGSPR